MLSRRHSRDGQIEFLVNGDISELSLVDSVQEDIGGIVGDSQPQLNEALGNLFGSQGDGGRVPQVVRLRRVKEVLPASSCSGVHRTHLILGDVDLLQWAGGDGRRLPRSRPATRGVAVPCRHTGTEP